MSFKTNKNQQMGMNDPIYTMSDRELKILRGSWAEDFANCIFPNINEEPFSVLFSGRSDSKPNAPINVILGLLILKEQFGLTDEECMHQLIFNKQFQYALHTSSFKEQPVNDNTFRRFRNRTREYEEQTGVDLIKEAFTTLTEKIAGIMDIDPSVKRIDSAMISSGFRRMSRLNLMHETLRLASRRLKKNGNMTALAEKYGGDEEPKDIGYRLKRDDIKPKMDEMLGDAIKLLAEYPELLRQSEEFVGLERMVDDQSKMTEDGRVLKKGTEISPESMQTPHEQDATFRKKAGKGNVGFVANFTETCDGDKNLITGYDMQKNTYSDIQFSKDVLGAMPDGGGETKTVIADGAYGSAEVLSIAETKNVNMSTTSLSGGTRGTFEAQFKIDGEGIIKECPAGFAPIDARRGNGSYQAHFDSGVCENCPNCDRCPGIFQKSAALIVVKDAALAIAEYAEKMNMEEHWELAKKRNGIEGVPSVLRRKYGIDHMREKGLFRKRQRLGFKLMAINATRLTKWMEDRVKLTFISWNGLVYDFLCLIITNQHPVSAIFSF